MYNFYLYIVLMELSEKQRSPKMTFVNPQLFVYNFFRQDPVYEPVTQ